MPGHVTLLTNNELSELIALWGSLTLLSLMALIMLTLAFIPKAWQQRLGVFTVGRTFFSRNPDPGEPADAMVSRIFFLLLGTGSLIGALFLFIDKIA